MHLPEKFKYFFWVGARFFFAGISISVHPLALSLEHWEPHPSEEGVYLMQLNSPNFHVYHTDAQHTAHVASTTLTRTLFCPVNTAIAHPCLDSASLFISTSVHTPSTLSLKLLLLSVLTNLPNLIVLQRWTKLLYWYKFLNSPLI